MRSQRNHERQVEIEVSPTTLLALAQHSIEDAEQLQNSLLAPAVSSGRMLDSKRMNTAIVTADLQPTVADTNAADQIYVRQEAIDANEVLVLVLVLQVLTRDLNLIKLEEAEFTEVRGVGFQELNLGSSIEFFLELVPPASEFLNVFVHGWLPDDKVGLKRLPNMSGKDGLSEAGYVSFRRRRQLEVLGV